MTLMKRNDQPQMKASRNRRRTGTPQEVGKEVGFQATPAPTRSRAGRFQRPPD
jgi:hypothetical protein